MTTKQNLEDIDYGAFRVSSIGGCPRKIYLQATGRESEPFTEKTLRAFHEGNVHENSIIAWAADNLPGAPYQIITKDRKGWQLRIKIPITPDLYLTGHVDAVGYADSTEIGWNKWFLFEAKNLGNISRMEKASVNEVHPQYYSQVQLYMHGLGLGQCWFIAQHKDTPKTRLYDYYYEQILYDPVFVSEELMRVRKLVNTILDGKEIQPPFTPKTDWHCKREYCGYSVICHPGG
jgi:CRISPR/Cas system-associated exonuclease Cas4 (RecB family)